MHQKWIVACLLATAHGQGHDMLSYSRASPPEGFPPRPLGGARLPQLQQPQVRQVLAASIADKEAASVARKEKDTNNDMTATPLFQKTRDMEDIFDEVVATAAVETEEKAVAAKLLNEGDAAAQKTTGKVAASKTAQVEAKGELGARSDNIEIARKEARQADESRRVEQKDALSDAARKAKLFAAFASAAASTAGETLQRTAVPFINGFLGAVYDDFDEFQIGKADDKTYIKQVHHYSGQFLGNVSKATAQVAEKFMIELIRKVKKAKEEKALANIQLKNAYKIEPATKVSMPITAARKVPQTTVTSPPEDEPTSKTGFLFPAFRGFFQDKMSSGQPQSLASRVDAVNIPASALVVLLTGCAVTIFLQSVGHRAVSAGGAEPLLAH